MNWPLPLAFDGPDPAILALLVPILAILIPIVAIITSHQRKMAEIRHRQGGGLDEVERLRREIVELKSLVHEQAIALDNLADPRPIASSQISDRLGSQG